MAEPRQADVGKVGSHGRELGVAVGRHIDAGERQVVQRVTERKRDTGYHIVPVIAAVRRAWHDAAADLIYHVCATRCRRWRWGRGWSISRCRRRRGGWCWSRCRACRRGWAGRAASHRCLDPNRHRCSCLEEADHRTDSLRRLIRIKPEVIQRAEANRVGILILRKSLRAPGDRASVLHNSPRCAAITLIVKRTVVGPGRMLNRRMKSDVRDVCSGSKRDAERLDGAIEVLVIESVFVMVNTGRRVGHFVTHEPNPVVARIGFELIHRRASPGHDSRLRSHGGACASKSERLGDSGYCVPAVRSVVVHVALARMRLAPGVFVRDDVFRFGKIRRPGFRDVFKSLTSTSIR